MTEDIIDEIVSLAATQIDAALDSGSSHASDMKYLAEFREDLINLLRENKLIQQKYCIFKVRILNKPVGLISQSISVITFYQLSISADVKIR